MAFIQRPVLLNIIVFLSPHDPTWDVWELMWLKINAPKSSFRKKSWKHNKHENLGANSRCQAIWLIKCFHFKKWLCFTYNPQAIKWHLLMKPLQVLIPPFMCHLIREVWKCCRTGPHLQDKRRKRNSCLKKLQQQAAHMWCDIKDALKLKNSVVAESKQTLQRGLDQSSSRSKGKTHYWLWLNLDASADQLLGLR